MKTIYLDSTFMCHATDNGTMQAVETNAFDGLCAGAIECYRYIPAGQAWTRPDGSIAPGPFVQAVKDPDAIQEQYELDEAAHLEELGSLTEEIYNEDVDMIDDM